MIPKLQPYMPQIEVATLDLLFYVQHPARVLEFGAGGSTVRWWDMPWVEGWTSIEHDRSWYRRVSAVVGEQKTVGLNLVDPDTFESYTDPVRFLCETHRTRMDLIFVDGLHRVECVKASPRWLAPGGIVILHDALRPSYQDAWHVYPNKVLLGAGDPLHNGLLVMWGMP